MKRRDDAGFTLVEALLAIAILSIAAVAALPAFVTQMESNHRNEARGEAVTAAEQVLEGLRLARPDEMPSGGRVGPDWILVGDREFEVFTDYCAKPQYCSTGSRHLRVEVRWQNRKVYDVETVYTKFD
jgi:prepilin-type N-terminal cleavage/methylation domain-containing protein